MEPRPGTREKLVSAVRDFFTARGYVEVETPIRIPVPAQELHIDAIRDGDMYLRTSPEFHMKRMLVDGAQKIFQVGPCYRAGERGRLHNPEFTMLEWYQTGRDYLDMARETEELVQYAVRAIVASDSFEWGGRRVDTSRAWEVSSVRDLFKAYASWDPVSDYDPDRFDLDLVNKVEPALADMGAVIVKDYPAAAAAFARLRGDIAERWELYLGGVEIANAYTELTDPTEQEARLETIAAQRARLGKEVYPQDTEFLEAMRKGLPECAGVALGLDRLAMLLAGADSIHDL